MKEADKRRRLHQHIHQKQQEIQQRFRDFRSRYELSGKTSFLLAQSECQGAVAAYQDILRMYGMHVTYDRPAALLSDAPESRLPDAASQSGGPGAGGMLQVLQAYCRTKHQEAEQKIVHCAEQYAVSGDNKYLFLQRQYSGEVMAYQNIGTYIQSLEPRATAVAVPDQSALAQPPEKRQVSATSSGIRHILVMESSSLIRKSIEMILSSEGFTVTTASDGVIGLDIAQKISPDLILMDSDIVRRNEEQLVFILRREWRLRKIPVILLEGTGRNLDERLSAQLGVIASIKKPFQPNELLQTIQATLSE